MLHVNVFTTVWRRLPLLFVMVTGSPLFAQRVDPDPGRRWSTSALLERYERETRARTMPSYGSQFVSIALSGLDTPTARRDSLLNGLEQFAATSTSSDVRRAATYKLASLGTADGSLRPIPGMMIRLTRIYRAQADAGVRLAIRDAMPEQAEREAAAAFLRTVATEPDPTNDGSGPHGYFSMGDPRTAALSRLSEMGAEGRAVLQAMHRSGEARSPQARAVLARMAQRGFPVIDARRREQ